jgi:hypothetical protein
VLFLCRPISIILAINVSECTYVIVRNVTRVIYEVLYTSLLAAFCCFYFAIFFFQVYEGRGMKDNKGIDNEYATQTKKTE